MQMLIYLVSVKDTNVVKFMTHSTHNCDERRLLQHLLASATDCYWQASKGSPTSSTHGTHHWVWTHILGCIQVCLAPSFRNTLHWSHVPYSEAFCWSCCSVTGIITNIVLNISVNHKVCLLISSFLLSFYYISYVNLFSIQLSQDLNC